MIKYTIAERLEIAKKIILATELVFKGGKLQKGMGLAEACESIWIQYQTYLGWTKRDPMIRDLSEISKNNRLTHMRHQAKRQVEDALYGNLKLKDKEKVDIALRFLEKVDEDFRERKEISINGLEFTSSMEDLEQKARLLLRELKEVTVDESITNTSNND